MSDYRMEFSKIEISSIATSTEKAILIVMPDGYEMWVPRTNVQHDDEQDIPESVRNIQRDSIRIVRWFADKVGLNG